MKNLLADVTEEESESRSEPAFTKEEVEASHDTLIFNKNSKNKINQNHTKKKKDKSILL